MRFYYNQHRLVRALMRFSVSQLLLTILMVGVTYAHDAIGQEILDQRVTLNSQTIILKDALHRLEQTAGVRFVFNPNEIPLNQRVKLEARSASLKVVLEELFHPLHIRFEVTGKQIALLKDNSTGQSMREEATGTALADQIVTGTVKDESGSGLPGVSVVVKGTQRGTTTDPGGVYRLEVPGDNNVVLIFSFVGYQSQEVALGNRSVVDINMVSDDKSLNEVVVVGYGTVKKSDVTGAVAKVGETDIKATPIVSFDRALQGRATGVQVVQNSARPGGEATIRIRGSGSVNASNDPLYVIDGFPTTGLNSINPNDIESIEILKDASATAIYGSRGSNGVVLVTTKRGKAGQTVITYDMYYGSQSVRRKIPLLNARQFAEFVNEAQTNNGGKPYFDGSSADRPLPATLGAGTDWQDEVLQNAPIQNHQLGVSGGSEKTRYAVSFGYYDQKGIVLNSYFKRYTLRANLDNDISSRVRVGVSLLGAYTKGNNARTEVDGNAGGGVTSASLSYAPTFPVFNNDGTYYKNLGTLNGYSVDNPVAIANEITAQNALFRILANSYVDYKIVEGLNLRVSFGADLQASKGNNYSTRLSLAGASTGGTASVSATQSVGWLNENTLNYSRKLSERHSFNALLGYTTQGLTTENVTASANTFPNDFSSFNNLSAGSSLVAPRSGASEWRLLSYLARVNYGFDDRFLFTLTGRRDGSSRFGTSNKFGFFPSGAIAWKVANEKWMKSQTLFSDTKLRVSYGLSGNQEIGNYRFLANITNYPYVLGGVLNSGATTAGIANPDLRWERNAQFDVGVDVGMLNNRIQLTADYYIKKTSDLLFDVTVPTSSGFTSTLKNIGSVQNKGIELSLTTINISKAGQAGFRWTSDFNLTFNQNKILTLDGRQEFTAGTDALIFATAVNPILLRVGSPLGNFYGRVTDGIFQSQAEVDASAQKNAKPGDLRYKDLNGDGIVNDVDRAVIGNANPKLFGGLNNTFSFKGFDLNIFLQGVSGNSILNYGTFDLVNLTGGNNQSARALDRWTPDNPSTTIPRANAGGGARILSDFQVEDGAYLRVKNISLGYNLPKSMLDRLSIGSAKIYVTAQNLFTFTNYTGYDPEVNRFGSSSLSQGLDYGAYPTAKTLLVGLNLRF
ncbi:TonB-dependent receptor [Dyadobacter sp. CY261]|uniref:SusC/RagA family TonB-linked outer membrane protein n=1 Tax=Dyadobacter sp. CY261 TaxID=2907203 RepID=UPI001F21BB82|nr:TonB-dependent receptor [Dyadobacter sp. CY261]MCF0069729.1 TonB-dependent receptor [Dyadobacter sp. CY261]